MKFFTLLLLYFFTLAPSAAFGAITYDTSSSGVLNPTTWPGLTTIAVNHTIGTPCVNSLLVVGVTWNNNGINLVSVIATGGALTRPAGATTVAGDGIHQTELWSVVGFSGAQTITATFDADIYEAGMTVSSYCGVNQATPHGTAVAGSGNDTPVTVDADGAAGDWLVDVAWSHEALTVDGSQAQRVNAATGEAANVVATSDETWAANPTTMSWTQAAGEYWGSVAIAIKPAAPVSTGVRHRPIVMQ